jgi:hypothetical protein
MEPIFTLPKKPGFNHRNMRYLALVVMLFFAGFATGNACEPEGEDLVKKAQSVVEEVAQRNYSGQEGEKKISYASVYPQADENNVVITFTIDEHNKIHVLRVQGGYALLNHYIKTSLEGKELKTENAIPGINYVMTVKIPASV